MSRMVRTPSSHRATGVSTIELFFDLVFVFTVTQVTDVIVEQPTPAGIARALLLLLVIWWMYDGYAWLTNHVAPDQTVYRLLMILSMGGFLVLALAVPDAFGADGVVFGAAFLLVTVVHALLFLQASDRGAVRAIRTIIPINVLGALAILAAGWVRGAGDWAVFALVIAMYGVLLLRPKGGFSIGAAHFVERHGLVMIIAFGESVVAVGIGAAGLHVGPDLVLGSFLALLVLAGMWWCYFAADDSRAEHAMAAFAPARAARAAGTAFGIMHAVMIFGVVVFSAGVKKAIGHSLDVPHPPGAWLLAAGTAVYLLGDAGYRRALDIGTSWPRLAASLLSVASVPLGLAVSGAAQLAALGVVVAAVVVADRRDPVVDSHEAARP